MFFIFEGHFFSPSGICKCTLVQKRCGKPAHLCRNGAPDTGIPVCMLLYEHLFIKIKK